MEDYDEIIENYKKQQLKEREEELAKNANLIQRFINFCSGKGIQLKQNNIDYIQTIGIIVKFPNIVGLLNNQIQMDKEGLYNEDEIIKEFKKEKFTSGYYYSDNYMIMAHPYFRRGHHEEANFAPRFIDIYWRFNRNGIDKYISIDIDRVRINIDDSVFEESDTWFGAKFENTISEIEDGIVKLRPPTGLKPFHIEHIFGNIYSLDIKWSSEKNKKIFYAEEFKEESSRIIKDEKEYYPAKYLHAVFNIEENVFTHFDGAIHFYTAEEYFLRRDSDFNYNIKNKLQLKSLSQKLFKINGRLDIVDWIELTSHYLTGNPLIFEYFEGSLPDHINEIVKIILNKKN